MSGESPCVRLVVVLLLVRWSRVVSGVEELGVVCLCVTGMVQVPAYRCGADRRPSNKHVPQSDDDSHTRDTRRESLASA